MIEKLLTFWLPTHALRSQARRKLRQFCNKKKGHHCRVGVSVVDNGKNNIIKIDEPDVLSGICIQIDADNTYIHIKKVKYIRRAIISVYNGNNQSLVIGDNTSIEGINVYLCGEGSSLTIEDNCMFADNISIWTADGHSVIDKNSQKILNVDPGHVIVGEHTWIAQDVKLLKRAQIPQNSIIGASSVVSKPFKQNYTVICGNPSKVVKKDVVWHRDDPFKLKKGMLNEKNDD